ncbi:MAG: lpxB, partial [Hyphomicrobiales bacterium]|nr:lpxB [Hyphomicrobiales bacterium]
AASGTVTLELALSGVPMVAGYKVRAVEAAFVRAVIQVESVLLPNLILDNPAVPEFLQENCTAQNMAPALIALLRGGPEREAQVAELKRLGRIMTLDGETPSQRAARIVVETARRR